VFYAFVSRHVEDAVALDDIFIGQPSVDRRNTTNVSTDSSATSTTQATQLTATTPWPTQQSHLTGKMPRAANPQSVPFHNLHFVTVWTLALIWFRLFIGVEYKKRYFHFTQLPQQLHQQLVLPMAHFRDSRRSDRSVLFRFSDRTISRCCQGKTLNLSI